MANLNGPEDWPDVYQLSKQDAVVGGEPDPETGEGVDNIPHLQLFQRTKWLRSRVDQLLGLFTNGKANDADKLDGKHANEFLGVNAKATDADKLDGQHASHFATASALTSLTSDAAIIAAVKRQDGSNSDVDADKLDGKHANEFLGVNAKATDADKLDGLHAEKFLRSDQSDETTGSLRISKDGAGALGLNRSSEAAEVGIQMLTNGVPNWLLYLIGNGGDISLQSRNYKTDGSARSNIFRVNWTESVIDFGNTPSVGGKPIVFADISGADEGCYMYAKKIVGDSVGWGGTTFGNNLTPSNSDNTGPDNFTPIGTWRCRGHGAIGASTLWQRID